VSFIDASGIVRRIGADAFLQCTDDDNDGVPDDGVVADIIADVDADVRSILVGKGWTAEQITRLESDANLRRQAAWIGADYTIARRATEFAQNPDGSNAYTMRAREARKAVTAYATMELRSVAEDQAGASANLQSTINPSSLAGGKPFVFAADPNAPSGTKGPGGF